MKKEDPRKFCTQCAAVYGLENPKMHSLRNSRHFIALACDDTPQPALVMIVPRIHERKVAALFRTRAIREESEKFTESLMEYLKKERAMKSSLLAWQDGEESIRMTQTYLHLKTHAHAKMTISY